MYKVMNVLMVFTLLLTITLPYGSIVEASEDNHQVLKEVDAAKQLKEMYNNGITSTLPSDVKVKVGNGDQLVDVEGAKVSKLVKDIGNGKELVRILIPLNLSKDEDGKIQVDSIVPKALQTVEDTVNDPLDLTNTVEDGLNLSFFESNLKGIKEFFTGKTAYAGTEETNYDSDSSGSYLQQWMMGEYIKDGDYRTIVRGVGWYERDYQNYYVEDVNVDLSCQSRYGPDRTDYWKVGTPDWSSLTRTYNYVNGYHDCSKAHKDDGRSVQSVMIKGDSYRSGQKIEDDMNWYTHVSVTAAGTGDFF